MIILNSYPIVPTIFPDKTSQVWKLDDELIEGIRGATKPLGLLWVFEKESELVHVLQLMTLVRSLNEEVDVILNLPYLPYARQDKEVSNDSTFALHTFLGLIAQAFDGLTVFDAHSKDLLMEYFGDSLVCVEPEKEIRFALQDTGADIVCYPDLGATTRYPSLSTHESVYMDKTRNQSTGEITGLELHGTVENRSVLIVDDLCDGGLTFREAAKTLYTQGSSEVSLYVSHGIFSHDRGVCILHEDGIKKVYDKDGVVSDVAGYAKATH